jgi:hypothetical protein
MLVQIGNPHVIDGHRDPEDPDGPLHYRPLEGERVTTVILPDSFGLQESMAACLASVALDMATGGRPAWIETESEGLRNLLLEHYQLPKKAGKRPAGWGDPDHPVVAVTTEGQIETVPKSRTRRRPSTRAVTALLSIHWALLTLFASRLYLRTTAGRDWQARVMGDPTANGTGVFASGSWMGLTPDATAPNAASTSLSGEITTGTLVRKQCAWSHTNGTQTYSLTGVFTSDQTVTVNKLGIFNAQTGGTLIFETLLNSASVMRSGDITTVTETVTL